MSDLTAVVACATRVAQQAYGPGISAHRTEVIAARGRSLVARCALTPHPNAPASVIVKQFTDDDARAFSDWAGVQFLTSLDGGSGIAPRYLGGDIAARLLVLEDLGGAVTVGDLLAAGNSAAIEEALRKLAVPMAQLIIRTAGTENEARYYRVREELPGGETLGRRDEAARWREAIPRASAWFAAFDCPLGAEFAAECDRVAETYAEPGVWLAFSHGDPAPSNNAIGPAGALLLDFEYGAYRHALYDITGWSILCPLPELWARLLHETFRRNLAGVWPPANDDAAYRTAWATLCAYRALAMLTWFPPDILGTDRPWAEGWTMRGALLTVALRLARATEGIPELAAIASAAAHLARAARQRWPEIGAGVPAWEQLCGQAGR